MPGGKSGPEAVKKERPAALGGAKQTDEASGEQVNFAKAQGSSRNDEADLRDVAREAAKKSQQQNH